MSINQTETPLQLICNPDGPSCKGSKSATILAPLPDDVEALLFLRLIEKYLAYLAIHARLTTAAALNESDCARAVIDALSDHIKFFSTVELDEFFAKEISRILSPNCDLHILCGHLKILLEDSNHEHKDKIIKFFKSVVCQ